MKPQYKAPTPVSQPVSHEPKAPHPDDTAKQIKREKQEVKEVIGHHQNDGQLGHKGRQ